MFHTLNTQRNILTLQLESKDICPAQIRVNLKKKITRSLLIFLMLETKVCTLKKLQLDFLIMELNLKVYLLETDLLLKRTCIQIRLRKTAPGLTLISQEKLRIFINLGSLKMLLHQTKTSSYKKSKKETVLRILLVMILIESWMKLKLTKEKINLKITKMKIKIVVNLQLKNKILLRTNLLKKRMEPSPAKTKLKIRVPKN